MRAAGVGNDAIAYGMIPPGLGPSAAPARSPVLILHDRRFSIRLTRTPSRLDMLHLVCHGLGFLGVRRCIRLRLLVRELTRMHHHKTEHLRDDASVAVPGAFGDSYGAQMTAL